MNRRQPKTPRVSRRRFLTTSAAAVTAAGVHSELSARIADAPSERINIAAVGAAGRNAANIRGTSTQNIVAMADIDADNLGKGSVAHPNVRKYRDFRMMLEKEADRIDAVVIGTPDHIHAPAAAMALRLKKHVYCEKPLTHTVFEARTLRELAQKNKLVTQMGTQIHSGDNYRRVVELIESGAIGEIRDVHVWSNAVYTGAKFTTGATPPAHVDWDLWLGPAPQRPYSEGVHPFQWRKFWDYGTGCLGDFGCHYMDLAHWALGLTHPTDIKAIGPKFDPVSCPPWLVVHYKYPKRGKLPPVNLTWYDSGRRPELLKSLRLKDGKSVNLAAGQLFIGSDGMILSNYSMHKMFRDGKHVDFTPPKQSIPKSIGHHQEWLHAIKTGGRTTCNFNYSGALAEAVLLGTVAYRSGEALKWDAEQLKVTNSSAAQQWVHKEYRKGWTL